MSAKDDLADLEALADVLEAMLLRTRRRIARTVTPLAPPAAPTGLTAVARDGAVDLDWANLSTAATYSVYQGTSAGGESGTPVQTGLTTSDATVSGLSNGTQYFFKVSASNGGGEGAKSSEVSATPTVASGEYPSADAFLSTPHDPYIPNFTRTPTIFSAGTGNWSATGSWDLGRIPIAGDIVGIRLGHTITYDVSSTAALTGVGVAGTLIFRTDIDTKLVVQHFINYETGHITIGTIGTPIDAAKTARIITPDVTINTVADPGQYGNGFLSLGRIEICGAAKTSHLRATTELTAGQTSITLETNPSGWRAGDRLCAPDSRQLWLGIAPESNWITANDPTSAPWQTVTPPFQTHDECPALSGVSGATLTTSALTYAHPGARDKTGTLRKTVHIGNLTRNVIFSSANPTGTRGHFMLTHHCRADIRYAAFDRLGRTTIAPLDLTTWDSNGNVTHVGTNMFGRYMGIHCHKLCGPHPVVDTYQGTFIGNVIDGGDDFHYRKAGISIHGTSYCLFQANVMYNTAGYALWTENGDEIKNIIDGNLSVRCTAYGASPNRGDGRGFIDLGHEGAAFWFRGFDNWVRNNVSASARMGFKYFAYGNPTVLIPTEPGVCPPEDPEYTPTEIEGVPLLQFENNESYGGWMNDGMQIWNLGFQYGTIIGGPLGNMNNRVTRYTCWNTYIHGWYGYEYRDLTMEDCLFLNDFAAVATGGSQVFGIYWGDYSSLNFTITDTEVHGYYVGIDLASTQGTTMDVRNCDFYAHIGIMTGIPYSTRGAASVEPNDFNFDNCIVANPDGVTRSDRTPIHIWRRNISNGSNINWIVQINLNITDWQGSAGDNFHVFPTGSLGSAILPATTFYPPPFETTIIDLGNPDGAGFTNTAALASHPTQTVPFGDGSHSHTYATAFNGQISPTTTTRSGVDGYVQAF